MATRASDTRLSVLHDTPGTEHLQICGVRLPTYNQVLLCYLAHMDKHRREDKSKMMKLSRLSSNCVVAKVVEHYQKAHIITIH